MANPWLKENHNIVRQHKIKDRHYTHLMINHSEYLKQPRRLGLLGRSAYDQYAIKIDCKWNIPRNIFHMGIGDRWWSCKKISRRLDLATRWQGPNIPDKAGIVKINCDQVESTPQVLSRGGERMVVHTAITRALGFTMISPSLYMFFIPSPLSFLVRVLLQFFFNTVTRTVGGWVQVYFWDQNDDFFKWWGLQLVFAVSIYVTWTIIVYFLVWPCM